MTEVLIVNAEVEEPKVKHKVGNFYYLTDHHEYRELVLLANVHDRECCFVSVVYGTRLCGKVSVASRTGITEDEINLMLEGTNLQAVLIDKIKITV